MTNKANEWIFQDDMVRQLVSNGWLLGKPENYNRELALYSEDLLGFVKETQDKQWQKFKKLYPNNPDQQFLERVASQLNKADPDAANKDMRTFGTLGVLRHELRDRGTRFSLCQFKPEHNLNPDTMARFVHLKIEEKEDWQGKKHKKETMIFPRYHQWDVINKLVSDAQIEGPGFKYLIQHSAGSGKSNSIAWTAHQLSSLYDDNGNKQFNSVIIVTDRTVLDDQLQETIYQFEHVDGVVGRINRKEGDGSISEKLATALESSQPIIIVTIQTFPYVLKAIENSVSLKERHYAIIADEAHSSQTGSTARQLKEVLMIDTKDREDELTSEDILDAAVASRRASSNLSYFAFTATPKTKTLELFGRLPNPDEQPSKINKPEAYHVYSMRQAIEEGFILDVLKNYTNYKVAYNLAQKIEASDQEVESKKTKVKLNQWVRLHGYNIAQKVQVIIEHFKDNIMELLGGQAKAMVVTSSRKETVRFKLGFDKYIAEKGYQKINAMVAFSGEVEFNDKDFVQVRTYVAQGRKPEATPNVEGLIGEKFTENNMNPNMKGRDMRKAFDSNDYQVIIVANKF